MNKFGPSLFLSIFFFTCLISFSQVTNPSGKTRIVGGNQAIIEQHPYQVSLKYIDDGKHFCGGTIIDEEWIVTAAHCLEGESIEDFKVAAGITGITQSHQNRTVELFINHPGYNSTTNDNDIALIKLSSPLTFDNKVQQIAYATKDDDTNGLLDAGTTATVSGWGDTMEDGVASTTLLAVNIPITLFSVANAAYNNALTSNMLAAGLAVGGKDACQGDSGGPLVVPNSDNTAVILAGVVSFGDGCARPNKYGIYAKVSEYAEWIERALNGDPLASFKSNCKYVKQGGTLTAQNLSINNPVNSWNVLSSGNSIFSANTSNFTYTPSVEGEYTLELTVTGNGTSDVTSTNFTVLPVPTSCEVLSDFDPNNQQVFTANGTNKGNSEFAYSMGVYHANPSTEFIMEVNAVRVHFTAPTPTSTKNFRVLASDYDNNTSQTVKLSDYTNSITANGYASIQFDKPLYLDPDQDFYADIDGSSLWASLDEFTIATSPKNSGESYYYDRADDEFEYTDLELGIEIEYCFYDLDPVLSSLNNEGTKPQVYVFPNPASSTETQLFESELQGELVIQSLAGVLISKTEIAQGKNSLPQLVNGVYIWKFVPLQGVSTSGKLFIK